MCKTIACELNLVDEKEWARMRLGQKLVLMGRSDVGVLYDTETDDQLLIDPFIDYPWSRFDSAGFEYMDDTYTQLVLSRRIFPLDAEPPRLASPVETIREAVQYND